MKKYMGIKKFIKTGKLMEIKKLVDALVIFRPNDDSP